MTIFVELIWFPLQHAAVVPTLKMRNSTFSIADFFLNTKAETSLELYASFQL